MKKLFLALILSLVFVSNAFGAEVNVLNGTLGEAGVTDEDGGHTYTFVKSNGEIGIINVGSIINANVFSPSGVLKLHKRIIITEEKFGGYIYDGTNHYFLFGNNNHNCAAAKTVYRVVKYNQSFNKMGSVSFNGNQVYAREVFCGESGLADLRISANKLFINDVVQEYMTENNYYFNNRSFVLDKTNLKFLNGVGGMALKKTAKGRNSLSDNMSAEYDGKYYFAVSSDAGIEIIKLDPEDAANLGKHVVKKISSSNNAAYYSDMLVVSPKANTKINLDGFEAGSDSFVIVGDETTSEGTGIFVSAISKDQVGATKAKTENIVEAGNISDIKTVKVSDSDIIVFWKNDGVLSYCHLNGKGEVTQKARKLFDTEIGDTLPYVAADGSLSWAYMVNNDDFALYTLTQNTKK